MVGGIGRFLGKIFKTSGPKAAAPAEKPATKEPPEAKAGIAAHQKDAFEKYEPKTGTPSPPSRPEPSKGPPAPVVPGSAPRPDGAPAAADPARSKQDPNAPAEPKAPGAGRLAGGSELDPLDPVREWGESPDIPTETASGATGQIPDATEVRGKSPLSDDGEDAPSGKKG